MSGSGSGPDGAAAPAGALTPERGGLFRWKGIIPFALLAIVLVGGWKFFGARAIKAAITIGGTATLGTQVDVASLSIHFFSPSIDIRGFAIADPDDLTRDRLAMGRMLIEVEFLPLLQKKVIVKRVTVQDVQSGNTRAVPAKPVPRDSSNVMYTEARAFVGRVKVPIMSLVPIDSLKAVVLNPENLKAVQAAVALGQQADSVKQTLDHGYSNLNLQPTIDSSTALVTRLQGVNVRTLGLDGARTALADVRRTAAKVDSAKSRVDRLVADAKRSLDSLQTLANAIDEARREDYASARSLLKLPTFDAPEIGAALFGNETLARFHRAVYWAALARKYTPPGLLPKESAGPKRARMAGTTVHFVKPASYPRFLLRRADLNLKGAGQTPFDYTLAAADITTDPAITGKPMLFVARRNARAGADSLRITGSLDHTGATPRDVVTAYMSGVALPSIALPMLPYSLVPGRAVAEMRLRLDGDRLSGSWSVQSSAVTWRPDSARGKPLNSMESLVARAITGIRDLQLTTEIGGTLQAPTLSVRSNIDRVVAERMRAVAGEEIAAAQAKLRAQVDRLVDEKSAPVKAKVAALRADTDKKLAEARTKLDEERKKLEERLKALTAGVNLPRLPGRPPA
jgi:uncharacterized protein (TIGR03545 family)